MNDNKNHPHRATGISGRTIGKMYKKGGARGGHESRPLRSKNQLRPMGANRFKLGEYQESFPPHIEEFMATVPWGHAAMYVPPTKK